MSAETEDEFKNKLRQRLRTIREKSGKSREQVMLVSGVSISTQKNWEEDSGPFNPTLIALRDYTAACGSSLGELFEPWLLAQPATENRYVQRLIVRAMKHPQRRAWVLTLCRCSKRSKATPSQIISRSGRNLSSPRQFLSILNCA